MKITYNCEARILTLNQAGYAEQVLEKFEPLNCAQVATPCNPRSNLEAYSGPPVDVPFREAVGAINFLAPHTCTDIAFTASRVILHLGTL